METITIAVLLALGAVIIFVASKFLGAGFKIFGRVLLIITVILSILSIFVFNDLQSLKRDVVSGKSTFILADNSEIYTAVGFKPMDGKTFTDESFDYYSKAELENFSREISAGKAPKTGANRTFVVTPAMLNQSYKFPLLEIDQNDILRILESQDINKTVYELTLRYPDKKAEISSMLFWGEERIKGYLLASLIVNYFQKSPGELSGHIKTGELKVYPETISFKVLKYIPLPK